ncbi:PTS sugar transporter subunit IIB [Desulfovibrio sp. OttesenSCG-928-F20]|nr:PTS sugar transporter subunit IIB [Desulfovibrio sp. OttesenSCG-928-M16]MDL2290593.1 PTS sugar transporter subunit IIB [Desulfovibrio sp. OttesenSCG-928-F20]
MIWFRIDNRLIHGQIIEAWLPYLNAGRLVVVNDELAVDDIRQEIMRLAIPERISALFVSMEQARAVHDKLAGQKVYALFLFSNCEDALKLTEQGVPMTVLNVGNMHYATGKQQICQHVAASENDLRCFDELRSRGVKLDFRCVPSDKPVVEEW